MVTTLKVSTAVELVLEFREGSSCHRLINKVNGDTTDWAAYRSFTYLEGHVGHTAYWARSEGIVTAEEFCRMAGVGKPTSE